MFRMEQIKDHVQALTRKVGTRKKSQISILKADLYKMIDSIRPGYSVCQVQDRALLVLTCHSTSVKFLRAILRLYQLYPHIFTSDVHSTVNQIINQSIKLRITNNTDIDQKVSE